MSLFREYRCDRTTVLLDLFCGAGGCAEGYDRAGFRVIGVDKKPQPNYPFEFVEDDALEYLARCGRDYDAIHASPPCQTYSKLRSLGIARNGKYPDHPDLVDATRLLLKETGKPYIIENVVGAPLENPITLCGSMFNLKVYRHRLFETNWPVAAPSHSPHRDQTPSAGNGVSPKGFISVCGTGGVKGFTESEILRYWQMAMGIDWMSREEMAQAIPPAYTEYIGQRLMRFLKEGYIK